MSQPTRTFLGWDRPLLHLLRDHVLSRYAIRSGDGGAADLSDCIVVLPGARAGRRLLELLALGCDESCGVDAGIPLVPPQVTTVQGVWDLLRVAADGGLDAAPMVVPSEMEERLAWVEALRSMHAGDLADLIRIPPKREELSRWFALADMLSRARGDLASVGVRFADLTEKVRPFADEAECLRWGAAARVESRYVEHLGSRGLTPRAEARRRLIDSLKPSHAPRVVVAGVVDPNPELRRLVRALGNRCEIVVFAPPASAAYAGGFDGEGGVIPAWWASCEIPIDEARIRVVHSGADQADAVFDEIERRAMGVVRRVCEDADFLNAEVSGTALPADKVTVGVPDAGIARSLILGSLARQSLAERTGSSAPPRLRLASGTPLDSTAPAILLAVVHEFVSSPTFDHFVALARHADVSAVIDFALAGAEGSDAVTSWIEVLDGYHADHVHWLVNGDWHTAALRERRVLDAMYATISQLLVGLHDPGVLNPADVSVAPLSTLCAAMARLIAALYFHPQHSQEHVSIAAADSIVGVLQSLADTASGLPDGLATRAPQAIDLVLRLIGDVVLPESSTEPGIDLLGWLELPMDDARLLVVTAMNEGTVPAPAASDPLLPNSLRTDLGLSTREARFARDAWIASVLAQPCRSAVFIAAKRGERNEPLFPSRLLLARDPVTIAQRLAAWTLPDREPRGNMGAHTDEVSYGPAVPLTRVLPAHYGAFVAPTSLRVTAFRDFIASPYAFYLRHILGLDEPDPAPTELDPRHFGTLIHDVVSRLANSDVANSTDPSRVAGFLHATLKAAALQRFGGDPMPAVWMQIEQAHARLESLAKWQADWAAQGWRIAYAEWTPTAADGDAASLVVDGVPMGLRGRIDRIDVNERLNAAAILDFKTGDAPIESKDIRSRSGEWKDLQLPLYRHLVRPLVLPPTLRLGHVTIPRDPAEVGWREFECSAADLAEADGRAAEIVRCIRRGEFDALGPRPPTKGILARICGTAYLHGAEEEVEG